MTFVHGCTNMFSYMWRAIQGISAAQLRFIIMLFCPIFYCYQVIAASCNLDSALSHMLILIMLLSYKYRLTSTVLFCAKKKKTLITVETKMKLSQSELIISFIMLVSKKWKNIKRDSILENLGDVSPLYTPVV